MGKREILAVNTWSVNPKGQVMQGFCCQCSLNFIQSVMVDFEGNAIVLCLFLNDCYGNGIAVGLMNTETSGERFYSSPSESP